MLIGDMDMSNVCVCVVLDMVCWIGVLAGRCLRLNLLRLIVRNCLSCCARSRCGVVVIGVLGVVVVGVVAVVGVLGVVVVDVVAVVTV